MQTVFNLQTPASCVKLYTITQIRCPLLLQVTSNNSYRQQIETDRVCLYIQYGLHYQESLFKKRK